MGGWLTTAMDLLSPIRGLFRRHGMRNVMLGHSGDGKTTFVASAYTRLQTPVAGFTLRSLANRDHVELLARGADIARGRYPPGTTARSEYWFALRHADTPVLNFTWADYRGGSLMESASGADTKLILADLRQADAIQVFVDAKAVAAGERVKGQLGRITGLIAEAVGEICRPIPLAIIMTKYDLVPPHQRDERLLAPIRGLIGAVGASNNITGSVFRVAAGPEAWGLERPVLFALRHGLVAERDRRAERVAEREKDWHRLKSEAESHKKDQERHAGEIRNRPVRTYFKSVFTDTNHYADEKRSQTMAEEKLAASERAWIEAQTRQAELDGLMPSVYALDAYLTDLESF